MSDERRLIARLAAADRSLKEQRLPPRAVRRIANRISRELDRPAGSRRFGWVPMLTFVAGAALVLMFIAWAGAPALPDAPAVASRPVEHWARIAGPDCHHREHDSERVEVTGACEVTTTEPSMRVQTLEEADLELTRRVVTMRRGSALFDVDPVVGDPVRIVVPGGTIVVVGTRFRVQVSGERGQVDLYEGELEFQGDDGSVATILAGQQFAFARRPQPSPAPAIEAAPTPEPATEPTREEAPERPESAASTRRRPDPPPRGEAAPTPEPQAGAIIEEVQRLRRRGEYGRAATRLREALKQSWPMRTADVLSYELGTILTRHLHDSARACTHWQQHLDRFRATRYRRQIEAAKSSLGCP